MCVSLDCIELLNEGLLFHHSIIINMLTYYFDQYYENELGEVFILAFGIQCSLGKNMQNLAKIHL